MKKEKYIIENGQWIKATKLKLFKHNIKKNLKRWKLVDKYSNKIIPSSELGRYFSLSPIEYEQAQKLFKEKGTLSYEFYPCGIGWGIRVHCLDKNNEIIDITDVTCW